MDRVIEGLVVLSVFSAVHERVIEFLRGLMASPRLEKITGLKWTWLRPITQGSWGWIPGVLLAFTTGANLLDCFRSHTTPDGTEILFFTTYLRELPWRHDWTPQAAFGCTMMGFAVTLGSQFWHDLAFGLVDLRSRLRGVEPRVHELLPAPAEPPVELIAVQDGLSRKAVTPGPDDPPADFLIAA